jgi:hypothetical protein
MFDLLFKLEFMLHFIYPCEHEVVDVKMIRAAASLAHLGMRDNVSRPGVTISSDKPLQVPATWMHMARNWNVDFRSVKRLTIDAKHS